jgi:hypothetical protein
MLRNRTLILALLSTGGTALADDEIRVLRQTPINENINIPPKVREECSNLGMEIPSSLAANFKAVKLVKEAKELKGKGKYLELELIEVDASQGSVFSGRKKMTVKGKLFDGGKETADVTAQRSSVGSFSTCENLAKVERTLGKDLAKWLLDPRPNTRL